MLPHLLIPEMSRAIVEADAKRFLVMNLAPDQDAETAGIPLANHLEILRAAAPGISLDAVIADPRHVDDQPRLEQACASMGAELVLMHLAHDNGRLPGVHDPDRLAVAIRTAMNR